MSENPEADATRGRLVINGYLSIPGTDPENVVRDLIADVLHAHREAHDQDTALEEANAAIDSFNGECTDYVNLTDEEALDRIAELIESARSSYSGPTAVHIDASDASKLVRLVERTGRETTPQEGDS